MLSNKPDADLIWHDLSLIDVAGFEDPFWRAILGDTDHGATEMFGGGDVVWEKEF